MTDPAQNTPPEINPFASPTALEEAGEDSPFFAESPPSGIRPRWWEIGLYVVLVVGLCGGTTMQVMEKLLYPEFILPWTVIFFWTLNGLAAITALVGGLIVWRAWKSGYLPQGPSPGQALLLAQLVGVILYLPLHALPLAEALWQIELSQTQLLFIFSLITLAMTAIFYALTPESSHWFGPARMFLALAFFGAAFAFLNFSGFVIGRQLGGGINFLEKIAWLCVGGHTLMIARSENAAAETRDWLHWTGVACWLAMIMAKHGMPFLMRLG